MKAPEKIAEEISQESSSEGQSIQEYIDYLKEVQDALSTSIDAAEADLDSQDEEE